MVYERICRIIAEELSADADSITMDTNLVDDLGADSLDLVELINIFEDEFGILITDNAVRELYTVREITEFIEKLIASK